MTQRYIETIADTVYDDKCFIRVVNGDNVGVKAFSIELTGGGLIGASSQSQRGNMLQRLHLHMS